MERTKAAFRAKREMVGITQTMLAKKLGVESRSVRRWENLGETNQPPRDAWDILDKAKADQDDLVGAALDSLERIHKDTGSYPSDYWLAYWTSQDQWDKYHVGPTKLDWRMANANNRRLASVLMDMGIDVEWTDHPTARN